MTYYLGTIYKKLPENLLEIRLKTMAKVCRDNWQEPWTVKFDVIMSRDIFSAIISHVFLGCKMRQKHLEANYASFIL